MTRSVVRANRHCICAMMGQVKHAAGTQTRERAFAAAYKHAPCSFPAAICNTRHSTHGFIHQRRLIGAARGKPRITYAVNDRRWGFVALPLFPAARVRTRWRFYRNLLSRRRRRRRTPKEESMPPLRPDLSRVLPLTWLIPSLKSQLGANSIFAIPVVGLIPQNGER